MKKIFIPCFAALLLTNACKKDSISSSNETAVEYQVTAANYTAMTIFYNNDSGQYVSGSYQSGWKYGFKISTKPFTAHVRAIPVNTTNINANVSGTVTILVNGTVAENETNSGTGSTDIVAQYVIQ